MHLLNYEVPKIAISTCVSFDKKTKKILKMIIVIRLPKLVDEKVPLQGWPEDEGKNCQIFCKVAQNTKASTSKLCLKVQNIYYIKQLWKYLQKPHFETAYLGENLKHWL